MNELREFTSEDWKGYAGLHEATRTGGVMYDEKEPPLIFVGLHFEAVVYKEGLFLVYHSDGTSFHFEASYRTAKVLASILPESLTADQLDALL